MIGMTPIEITIPALLMAFVVIAGLYHALLVPAYTVASRTGKVLTRWQKAKVWCYHHCVWLGLACFWGAVVLLIGVCLHNLIQFLVRG
jgi:hypothetical protein